MSSARLEEASFPWRAYLSGLGLAPAAPIRKKVVAAVALMDTPDGSVADLARIMRRPIALEPTALRPLGGLKDAVG